MGEVILIIPVLGHFTSYDGTVVHSFRHRMRDYLERMARYDLIFGVASADALVFALNDKVWPLVFSNLFFHLIKRYSPTEADLE